MMFLYINQANTRSQISDPKQEALLCIVTVTLFKQQLALLRNNVRFFHIHQTTFLYLPYYKNGIYIFLISHSLMNFSFSM